MNWLAAVLAAPVEATEVAGKGMEAAVGHVNWPPAAGDIPVGEAATEVVGMGAAAAVEYMQSLINDKNT